MLLRGVKFPPPTLDKTDIEIIKSKAQNSGRSFGGAPLRNGNGKGGRINYAASDRNDRPNPFAAHLDPGFVPPPHLGVPMPPPGWVPPPPGSVGFSMGPPPPPPRGGFADSYRPSYPPAPPVPPQPQGYQYGGYYGQGSHYSPPQHGSYSYSGQSSYYGQGSHYSRQQFGSSYGDRREDGNYRGGYHDQPRQGRDSYHPRRSDGYGRY